MLVHTQQVSSHIAAVQDPQGFIRCSTSDILSVFQSFYIDLYLAKVHPSKLDIANFLDDCSLPQLSASDVRMLNAPLTEDEFLTA